MMTHSVSRMSHYDRFITSLCPDIIRSSGMSRIAIDFGHTIRSLMRTNNNFNLVLTSQF